VSWGDSVISCPEATCVGVLILSVETALSSTPRSPRQEPVRHLRAAVRGGGLVRLHQSACQGWAGLSDDGPGGWVPGGGPAAGPAEHWGRGTGRLRPQARLAPRGQRKVGPWCGTRAEGCAPRCLWAPGSLRARCTFAISYVHTFSCHVMPFLFALVCVSCADPDSSARFSGSCCGSWAW
jgi:hypothetical protein